MDMKKFILPLFAAAMLASCSNEEAPVVTGETETNYLSINLVTNFGGATRATDDNEFEQGLQEENRVNKVRFYFFDSTGAAAQVKRSGGGFVNYYDWTPENNNFGEREDNNVTNVIHATVVIESLKDQSKDDKDAAGKAASVVAIINPTPEFLANTSSLSKTELQDVAQSYTAYTFDDSNKGQFVMSNTVYGDDAATSPSKLMEVSTAGHYYPTPEAAVGNPVTIYVERVLAKVRLASHADFTAETITMSDGTLTVYDTQATYTDDAGNPRKIYVKFCNWGVTATPDKSYLVKDIDPTWQDIFGVDNLWNEPARHRSYWAINPAGVEYLYPSYNEVVPSQINTIFGEANARYPHENAGEITSSNYTPSKVIIGAQLVKEDGTPLTIMKYGFDNYFDEASLKAALLRLITTAYYVEDPTAGDGVQAGSTKYRQIGLDDVEFVTEGSLVANPTNEDLTCYTRIQLTKTPEGQTPVKYYTIATAGDGSKTATEVNASEINDALKALGRQKIWTNGYTYYHFDIHHIGYLADGETKRTGVVRNHIYNVTLRSLVGMGTPVYDPNEELIPQKPEEDDTYLAAEIKVLSWRLVDDEVKLEW